MADFDGETFDPDQDGQRLTTQLERVREVLADGQWHTLPELAAKVNGVATALSARIRDFRKRKFGRLVVESRRVPGQPGLWEYRMPPNQTPNYEAGEDENDAEDGVGAPGAPVTPEMPTPQEFRIAVDELRPMLNHPALKEQRALGKNQLTPTFLKVMSWMAAQGPAPEKKP